MKLYIILSSQGFTDIINDKLLNYRDEIIDEIIICSTYFDTHMFKNMKKSLQGKLTFKKLTIENLFNFYQEKAFDSVNHISASKNLMDSMDLSSNFCYQYKNRTDILNYNNEIICKEYSKDNQVTIRDFFKNKQLILKEILDEFNYISCRQHFNPNTKKVIIRQFLNYKGQVVIQKNYSGSNLHFINLPLEGKFFYTEHNFRKYWYEKLVFDPRYKENIIYDETSLIWKELKRYIYSENKEKFLNNNSGEATKIISNDAYKVIAGIQRNN